MFGGRWTEVASGGGYRLDPVVQGAEGLGVVTHIVWDWNGTLFDDICATYGASCEIFAALGLPTVTLTAYRAAYTRPISLFYSRLFARTFDAAEFDGLDQAFHTAYRVRMTQCSLAEGAKEALACWRDRGGSQSLLSMWRHHELVPFVERCGIAGEFIRIDGLRGPGGGRKSAHLARHLAALGLRPTDVLLVGDSIDDAEAAADVGASCALYDGGYHDRGALDAVGVPVVGRLEDALPETSSR